MNIKKINHYHFNRYQKNLAKNILANKTTKQKLKEISLLFFSIIFLWILFSISAAISNAAIKMQIKDWKEKAVGMTKNVTQGLLEQENVQQAAIKNPKNNLKKDKKSSSTTPLPSFFTKMSMTEEIENAENSNDYIKLSNIAELTDEKGLKTNEKLENPIWQQEEDLQEMAFDHSTHKVEKNESLWLIAQRYGISIESIITANDLSKEKIHALKMNKKLKIPHFSGIYHKIKNGDNLLKLSQKYNVSLEEIRKYNKIPNYLTIEKTIFVPRAIFDEKKRQSLFGSIFTTPVEEGVITSKYGLRFHPIKKKNIFHTGIDIKKHTNNRVFSIADGKVIKVANHGNYGKHVIIQHPYGYTSLYAHLSAILVKNHQKIKRGARIGRVGATGLVTGAHLHFELKKNNQYINPKRFFNLKEKIEKKIKYVVK